MAYLLTRGKFALSFFKLFFILVLEIVGVKFLSLRLCHLFLSFETLLNEFLRAFDLSIRFFLFLLPLCLGHVLSDLTQFLLTSSQDIIDSFVNRCPFIWQQLPVSCIIDLKSLCLTYLLLSELLSFLYLILSLYLVTKEALGKVLSCHSGFQNRIREWAIIVTVRLSVAFLASWLVRMDLVDLVCARCFY